MNLFSLDDKIYMLVVQLINYTSYSCVRLNTGPAWIRSQKINYSIFYFYLSLFLSFLILFFFILIYICIFFRYFFCKDSLSNLAIHRLRYHITFLQTFYYDLLFVYYFTLATFDYIPKSTECVMSFFWFFFHVFAFFFYFWFGLFLSCFFLEPFFFKIGIVLKSVKRCALNDDRRKQRPSRRPTRTATSRDTYSSRAVFICKRFALFHIEVSLLRMSALNRPIFQSKSVEIV